MAQLVEQRIRNAWVAGSSPARGSLFFRKPCLHLPKILFAREISTSVVHGLPKPVRRVRLPYLAQNISNPGLNPGLLVLLTSFQSSYYNKITHFELLYKLN